MGAYTTGLLKVEFGDLATDGVPATTLSALGFTNEGSFTFNQDDPTTQDFFVEELDDAVFSTSKPGAISFTMQIANPDADAMVKLFGGTAAASGSGANAIKTWSMPDVLPTIEKTVKASPKTGFKEITFNRASVRPKFNGQLSRNGLFVIEITVTMLQPTKAGTPKLVMVQATPA